MAAENRRAEPTLEQTLFDEPYRFEFFQAVRLLERLHPERQLVGRHDTLPSDEVVRFRTRPSLHFPPSEIFNLSRNVSGTIRETRRLLMPETADAATAETTTIADSEIDPARPPDMVISFIGLTGAIGVMPSHITELVAERVRYKDTALWEFLDLFNHRIASLFHRAWERYRFYVPYERGAHDDFTEYLFDLIGMGTRNLRGRMNLPDEGLLLYSGLISQRPHSASVVAAIVGDYFRVPARLEQFTGQWLDLDSDSVCRLGTANSELGFGTIAGARVWDVQSKFRLRLGALTLDQFARLVPSGGDFRAAIELTRFVAGAELDFDVQLVLKREEVPACKLSGADSPVAPRLGWTTWLKTETPAHDDSQVILNP